MACDTYIITLDSEMSLIMPANFGNNTSPKELRIMLHSQSDLYTMIEASYIVVHIFKILMTI